MFTSICITNLRPSGGTIDTLSNALHDQTNDDRRHFIAATEAELSERKAEWKEHWDETTLDLMWSMYNDIACTQARKIGRHTEHRDELDVIIEKERGELRQEKAALLARRYEQFQAIIHVTGHFFRRR